MIRLTTWVVGLCVMLLSASSYASSDSGLDVPALIKQASQKYQGDFKISDKQAVAQLDDMLTQQYVAGGRLVNEKNAYLKSLYYQAAALLMNGYPIAGGTIVAIARTRPEFRASPGGRGLAHFVDAMLSPAEDDDTDLVEYQRRAQKARAVLAPLRPALQVIAQVRVMGEIYRDDIAIAAGKTGLESMSLTKAERDVIERALKAD